MSRKYIHEVLVMKKEFKLRHAALISALALAMGAPLAFAEEVPADSGAEVVTLPSEDSAVGEVVTGDVTAPEVSDPAPLDEVPVEALPGDDGVVTIDPVPVEGGEVVLDEVPVDGGEVVLDEVPVDGGEVVIDEVPVDGGEVVMDEVPVEGGEVTGNEMPVDDCGMICWSAAELPPGAVQRGGEEVVPQILQFGVSGEAPEPTLNVSAELSGAMGVAEQLGAADVALQDAAEVDPLATTTPTAATVTTATAAPVNVIRDGHLR